MRQGRLTNRAEFDPTRTLPKVCMIRTASCWLLGLRNPSWYSFPRSWTENQKLPSLLWRVSWIYGIGCQLAFVFPFSSRYDLHTVSIVIFPNTDFHNFPLQSSSTYALYTCDIIFFNQGSIIKANIHFQFFGMHPISLSSLVSKEVSF